MEMSVTTNRPLNEEEVKTVVTESMKEYDERKNNQVVAEIMKKHYPLQEGDYCTIFFEHIIEAAHQYKIKIPENGIHDVAFWVA